LPCRAQLVKRLTGLTRAADSGAVATVVMMAPARRLTLHILLKRRIVLLGSRKISGLKMSRKLVDRLGDGTIALGR
jgi:hypothetical protein